MNIRNRIYVLVALLIAGSVSCSVETPQVVGDSSEQKIPHLSTDALDGQLLVRFDQHVADVLDKAGLTKSGPGNSMKRSGILSVDEILDLVDGYQIERVFPVDVRSEDKVRSEGLHLWYVVRFDEKHPVEKVAADLAMLGEVSRG